MRKFLMMVATALVLMGTSVSTKAVRLLKTNDVGISVDKENSFILKHASELFGDNDMAMTSHTSHGSHGSHSSHSSHYSGY